MQFSNQSNLLVGGKGAEPDFNNWRSNQHKMAEGIQISSPSLWTACSKFEQLAGFNATKGIQFWHRMTRYLQSHRE
jgi:hypothetical protein